MGYYKSSCNQMYKKNSMPVPWKFHIFSFHMKCLCISIACMLQADCKHTIYKSTKFTRSNFYFNSTHKHFRYYSVFPMSKYLRIYFTKYDPKQTQHTYPMGNLSFLLWESRWALILLSLMRALCASFGKAYLYHKYNR